MRHFLSVTLLGTLVFLGAGCSPQQAVNPPTAQNSPTQETPAVTRIIPSATSSTAETTTTSTQAVTSKPEVPDLSEKAGGPVTPATFPSGETRTTQPSSKQSPPSSTTKPTAQPTIPAQPPAFAITSILIDTSVDVGQGCARTVTARARITTKGTGRISGVFGYHDAATSDSTVADTDQQGGALVQTQRTFQLAPGASTDGSVQFNAATPNELKSNRATFRVSCPAAQAAAVQMTGSSFVPAEIKIAKGGKLIFKNTGSVAVWPASDVHPSHTLYSAFDPKRGIEPGGTYEITFPDTKTYSYHDHLNPGVRGNVIVE